MSSMSSMMPLKRVPSYRPHHIRHQIPRTYNQTVSAPITSSVPCHVRDVKSFILRGNKYIRSVEQFSKYESLPMPLLLKLLRRVKNAKSVKCFQFKWNCFPALEIHPNIIKSVFKHHCKYLQKYDVNVQYQNLPFHYRSLSVALKNCLTASVYSEPELLRLTALKCLKKLTLKFSHEAPDYRLLQRVFRRLPKLQQLFFIVAPNMFARMLNVVDQLKNNSNRQNLNIDISIEGDQDRFIIPKLKNRAQEHVVKMSFQSIRSDALLNSLFTEKFFAFSKLRSLVIGFNNISVQTAYYLGHLVEISNLESLTLTLGEIRLKNVAAEVVRRLRLPPSLQTLELTMPLYLKSLITKHKRLLKSALSTNARYTWRDQNIFEDEVAFYSFFQSIRGATELKSMTLDFNLMEEFNPHYTNFIVSILSRVPNLHSFEAYVKDTTIESLKEQGRGRFDLSPFLNICSQLEQAQQIEISMPNLLFDGAEFKPITKKLKSFTIGVNENDEEEHPMKFYGISAVVKRLLNSLLSTSPDLVNLTLDFAEVIDEKQLLSRFNMIQKFKKLEGLGLRFNLKECQKETALAVGNALHSLNRLNTMVLKFTDSDKNIYRVQNFIKYHRTIRDMLVQLNESSWIDNDYFLDPSRSQIAPDLFEVDINEEGKEVLVID